MAEDGKAYLRIYCLCGQKMKVDEKMFGHRARCITCRQKLRVPRADEIPEGMTELHLKDHPEFLRNGGPKEAKNDTPPPPKPASDPNIESGLDRETPRGDARTQIPLDVLEPLRLLCSLEYRLVRERTGDGEEASALDLEEDTSDLDKVFKARTDLNEALRTQLEQVEGELKGLREDLVQLTLAVRTGDRDFVKTQAVFLRLRCRRDHIERRRINLRGWLACDDPYLAGGYYAHASVDRIPDRGFRIASPPEPDLPRPLIEQHTEGLRDALEALERADRRFGATERLATEGKTGITVLESSMLESIAERKRAEAAILFFRNRLRRLERDVLSDLQAVEGQLERARTRWADGDLSRPQFAALRRGLRAAQGDLTRTGELASTALSASRAQDVPHVRRTAAARHQPRTGLGAGFGTDAWLAFGAALLLMLCLLTPMQDGVSPFLSLRIDAMAPLRMWLLGVFASAALVLGAGFVPSRHTRGWLLAGLWAMMCLAGAVWLRRAADDPGPVGQALHQGGIGMWLLHPGMVLAILASLGVIAAAWFALAPGAASLRFMLAGGMAATCALAAGVATGFGESQPPEVYLSCASFPRGNGGDLVYETVVTVGNKGGRVLVLALDASGELNACRYVLERGQTGGAWMEMGLPSETRLDGAPARTPSHQLIVKPGGEAALTYELPAGRYRIRVTQPWAPGDEKAASFSLSAWPRSPEPARMPPDKPQEPPKEETVPDDQAQETVEPPAPEVTATLRGLASVEGRDLRFAFTLSQPDGTSANHDVALGEDLSEGWRVVEYNDELETVTLGREGEFLVLHGGEAVPLPAAMPQVETSPDASKTPSR